MFWKRKRKKPVCNHEWHHLQNSYIYIDQGCCVDAEEACWILCVKCEKEIKVYEDEWRRIKKRQELLQESRLNKNLNK